MSVPPVRVRHGNTAPVARDGEYVLYWMIAHRRMGWNFSLQHAVDWARELRKPLLVFEPLRCDYPWASDRHHRFVLQGMADNARHLGRRPVGYFPYVEPASGAGKGLLEALARRASVVVTDDYPAFFLPEMVNAAGRRLAVRLEVVDANGLVPLRATDRTFPTAFAFRRFVHGVLPELIGQRPLADPLSGTWPQAAPDLPQGIPERWPPADPALLADDASLRIPPLDHSIPPVATKGGSRAGRRALVRFVEERLARYAEERNHPDAAATSGLSPYLHYGHVSAHEVFHVVTAAEGWSPLRIEPRAAGRRSGWWGTTPDAEAFLDELITWRELGFNRCAYDRSYGRHESLPRWARETLAAHGSDARPYLYSLEELEAFQTHDPVWNAAQRQLVTEGVIHGYLRMLWGKKILEWTRSPRQALSIMIELNNAYAIDGRDPNSSSGIFWVLGRYDRPWGPERPVFGTVRYMSSENTRRKLRMAEYLERFGGW